MERRIFEIDLEETIGDWDDRCRDGWVKVLNGFKNAKEYTDCIKSKKQYDVAIKYERNKNQ